MCVCVRVCGPACVCSCPALFLLQDPSGGPASLSAPSPTPPPLRLPPSKLDTLFQRLHADAARRAEVTGHTQQVWASERARQERLYAEAHRHSWRPWMTGDET